MAKRGLGLGWEGKVMKTRIKIAFGILVVAVVLFNFWFFVIYPKPVETSIQFVSAMENCKGVSWTREDAQASWLYIIKGRAGNDACKVEVQLLQMKEGTISSEKLQGQKMTCILQKGDTQFPEKNIADCTGELKEQLQDIIIQRMHNYLLQNVGEIRQEFEGL